MEFILSRIVSLTLFHPVTPDHRGFDPKRSKERSALTAFCRLVRVVSRLCCGSPTPRTLTGCGFEETLVWYMRSSARRITSAWMGLSVPMILLTGILHACGDTRFIQR